MTALFIDDVFFTNLDWVDDIIYDSNKTLVLFINTDGGDFSVAITAMNLFKKYDKVIAVVLGKALSSGGLLFFNSDERYVGPTSTVMLHEPTATSWSGYSTDIKTYSDIVLRINKIIGDDLGFNISNTEQYFLGEDLIEKGLAKPITKKLYDSFKRSKEK